MKQPKLQYYTTKQVADIIGVSVRTVHRYNASGYFGIVAKRHKKNGELLFSQDNIDEYMSQLTI